jgi:FAD/FMN-containing dehydrogenase
MSAACLWLTPDARTNGPPSDDVWRVALDATQTLDDRAGRRRFPRSVVASRVMRHRHAADILATAARRKGHPMHRRSFLAAPLFPLAAAAATPARPRAEILRRVRPSDPNWPPAASWERLENAVGGQLIKLESPLAPCHAMPASEDVLKNLSNPYYLSEQPALTGTTGWVDAWTSTPSVYAVAAKTTRDVVAAVNFARENNLRLVVKGGGHSYAGTSAAPDSLLLWTRAMNDVGLHDAFVATGCQAAPVPAVTIGAGAIWMPVYEAVMSQGGRYVQGGGCATVGVAGLVQSGGFGNFSKHYGTAAGSLLEAEVVTADGVVRTVNACQEPELFWALKGGGGGTLGVITSLTLQTHDMPETVGAVFMTVKARTDAAFRQLIRRFVSLYNDSLFNPHWGEEVDVLPGNIFDVAMVFQRLDAPQARASWQPLLDWLSASPKQFSFTAPVSVLSLAARDYWNGAYLRTHFPKLFLADDRPGVPAGNVWSAGDASEASQFVHGLTSAWLPASLLNPDKQKHLADALFAASRHFAMALHFNKGLAGAPDAARAAARDTAMNPEVVEAFALAISGAHSAASSPDLRGHEPDLAIARRDAANIDRAMSELLRIAPGAGSYYSESNFFQKDWQRSHWGTNYPRLAAVKRKYDPEGLFVVHHGVGSEPWLADGFTRVLY